MAKKQPAWVSKKNNRIGTHSETRNKINYTRAETGKPIFLESCFDRFKDEFFDKKPLQDTSYYYFL